MQPHTDVAAQQQGQPGTQQPPRPAPQTAPAQNNIAHQQQDIDHGHGRVRPAAGYPRQQTANHRQDHKGAAKAADFPSDPPPIKQMRPAEQTDAKGVIPVQHKQKGICPQRKGQGGGGKPVPAPGGLIQGKQEAQDDGAVFDPPGIPRIQQVPA